MTKRRALSAVLCCLTLAMSAGLARAASPTVGACPSAGATEDTPTQLPEPVLCRATFVPTPGDPMPTDWYAVPLARSQRVAIQVSPEAPQFSTNLILKDPSRIPSNSLCAGNESADTNTIDSCDLTVPASGNWILGVAATAGTGSYQISIVGTPAQNDCGQNGDAPEGDKIGSGGLHAAFPLTLSNTGVPGQQQIVCLGNFSSSEAQDWYSFPASVGEDITLTEGPDPYGPTGAPAPSQAASRVQTMTLIPPSGGGKPVDDSDSRGKLVFHVKQSGTYYVELDRSSAGEEGDPYSVTIATQQNDCGAAANEAGNDSGHPYSLSDTATGSFVSCLGALDTLPATAGSTDQADAVDWYTFNSVPSKPVAIGIDSSAGECHTMKLFRSAVSPSPTKELTTCDGAAPAVFNDPNTTGNGTWFVEVVNGSSILSLDSYGLGWVDQIRSQDSFAQPVTVTSHSANTTIGAITTRGLNAGDFVITPDGTCAPGLVLVHAGDSCTVAVLFHPNEVGQRAAELAISASDATGPTTRLVSLNGNAIPASIQFTPTNLAFATTKFKSKSDPQVVTITNVNATGSLSIGSIHVEGKNPGDFEISKDATTGAKLDQCSNQILSPGASCTVKVDFSPQGNGARAGQLIVPNDSPNPARTDLTGTGQAPILAIDSAPDFNSAVGTPLVQNVVVHNTGDDVMTNIVATQPGGDFSLVTAAANPCAGITLAAKSSCNIGVQFLEANNAGMFHASLNVSSSAPNGAQQTTLTGNATNAGAAVSLTPNDELDFDAHVKNDPTNPQILHVGVANKGGQTTTITALDISPAGEFINQGSSTCHVNNVIGTKGTPTSTCQVDVAFLPTRIGPRGATFSIAFDNKPARTVQLLGLGISSGGHLSITAAPHPGDQLIGTTGARSTMTVKNVGKATVSSISLSSDSSEFVIRQTSCTGSLAANSTCTAAITFTPTAIGPRCGNLSLFSDDPAGTPPQVVCANGLAPQASAVAPAFPIVTLGQASAIEDVVVANKGTAPLVVSGFTVQNADPNNPDFFPTDDGCTDQNRPSGATSIPAGGRCAISFVFRPSDAGARTATVQITTDALGPSPTLQLSGVSLQPEFPLTGKGSAYTLTANGVAFAPPPVPNDCGLTTLTNPPDASSDITKPDVLTGGPTFSCDGQLQGAGDADFYQIPGVVATDIVHLSFSDALPAGVLVCQYDQNGQAVDGTYDANNVLTGCGTDHRITSADIDKTWVIGVTGPAGASYSFDGTLVHQNDCGIGKDAANTLDEAQSQTAIDASTPFVCAAPPSPTVPAGTSDGDLADPSDGVDIYKVTTGSAAPMAGALAVTLTPVLPPDLGGGSDFDVIIHAPDGTTTAVGPNGGSGQPEVAVGSCNSQTSLCKDGVWYVEIRYIRGARGPYKMVVAGRTI